ncbi:hypothetical protein BHU62_19790 [Serratia marcescens]|uniref:Uncharacterized protein n=1 Tax=Serratia marcescens TaxID=615 RepID=A0A1Q4NVX1_SERMA|nr:hypothetical protein [Serratia marcescens]OKB65004.1 hypothetical protein BHU62_19790 [Serratia marcescens]
MGTLVQINVQNNSPALQNFFFFQQPSVYVGGAEVYSNSLLSTTILPSSQGGSVYTFLLDFQYYAGVQQQVAPPQIGQPSGYSSAIQPIDLTPAAGGAATNNSTNMIVSPALGLTPATQAQGVQPGAFRIVSPTYNPLLEKYNGGSAVRLVNGTVVLSNFVTVNPGSNLDCQPILQFYVQTGNYTSGTVMNFTSSSVNAALCDATTGFLTFNVTYNANGTWTVVPSTNRAVLRSHTSESAHVHAVAPNAEIKNEAGTRVISQGYANNFHSPITISNLTDQSAIHLHGEYQIGQPGGHFTGRMCIAKADGSATFK